MTIANIMCVLNEAEFIEAAVLSALPGVYKLIVIDQGSTDGTFERLKKIEAWHPTIMSVISSNKQTFTTLGEAHFRRLAIDLCFGHDWLMRTDGDEVMEEGWHYKIEPWLNHEHCDAIYCRYWQLIGSSEFISLDSPVHINPIFYRRSSLQGVTPPKEGTKVHCAYIYSGNAFSADVDVFHCGYAKKNLTERFRRNITRGDWTLDATEQAEFLRRAEVDPLQFLPKCIPTFPQLRWRMPGSILERVKYTYDPATQRITGRTPL